MLAKLRKYYKEILKVSLIIVLLAGAYVGFGYAERYRSQTRQWEALFMHWAEQAETQRREQQAELQRQALAAKQSAEQPAEEESEEK